MASFAYYYRLMITSAIKWIAVMLALIFGLIFIVILMNFVFRFHWKYPWWSPLLTLAGIAISLAIVRMATSALRNLHKG